MALAIVASAPNLAPVCFSEAACYPGEQGRDHAQPFVDEEVKKMSSQWPTASPSLSASLPPKGAAAVRT